MQTAYFAFNDNLKDFRDSDWLIAVQTFSVENIPEKKVMRLNYAEQETLINGRRGIQTTKPNLKIQT